jgi:hypothetical protein
VPEPQSGSVFITQSGLAGGFLTATSRTASGAIGAPVPLSTRNSCRADAASNPTGSLVVAWTSPCPVNPEGGPGSGVQGRRRAGPGLPFHPAVQLTTNGSGARVAHSANGDAIVAFHAGTAGPSAIAASAFEDPGAGVPSLVKPVIGGGSDPVATLPPASGGTVGLSITCPVACSVVPQGILATNGIARATAARTSPRSLRARRRTTVNLRFSPARMATARRALRNGHRASVSYTVTIRERGSKTRLSFSRRVRLKSAR